MDELDKHKRDLQARRARLSELRSARSRQASAGSNAVESDVRGGPSVELSSYERSVIRSPLDDEQEGLGSSPGGKQIERKVEVENIFVNSVGALAVNVEPQSRDEARRQGLLDSVSEKYAKDILGERKDGDRGGTMDVENDNDPEDNFSTGADTVLKKMTVVGGGPKSQNRGIASVQWHPKYEDVLICAHARNRNLPTWELGDEAGLVMLWSMQRADSKQPDRVLRAHSDVVAIETLPIAAPTIVVGGLLTGEIVMWDTRTQWSTPAQISGGKGGPRDIEMPMYTLQASSNDSVLVSGSRAGTVSLWSPANLTKPLEKFSLRSPSTKQGINITALDVPSNARFGSGGASESSKSFFFVGDDEGTLFRMGNAPKRDVEVEHQAHEAPILSLSSHPASIRWPQLSDLALAASMDWTAGLWSISSGGCKRLQSFELPVAGSIADAQWSPTHPGVFVASDAGAGIACFDLSRSAEDVLLSRISVGSEKENENLINKLKWNRSGNYLAAGDVTGHVHIYKASSSVASPPLSVWDEMSAQIRSMQTSTANDNQDL